MTADAPPLDGRSWDRQDSSIPAERAEPRRRARLCAAFGLSDDDLSLADCGLAVFRSGGECYLTRAGALFLSPEAASRQFAASAVVDIVRNCGENYDLRKEFSGSPDEQAAAAADWLCEQIGFDMTIRTRRYELERIPKSAVAEIMSNAVTHRDYRSANGSQIRVDFDPWPDQRITVLSPGGFASPGGPADSGEGRAAPRNPVIAAAMKALGAATGDGGGIARAQAALAANLNPPAVFRLDPTLTVAVLDGANAATPEDRAWFAHIRETTGEVLSSEDKKALSSAASGAWVCDIGGPGLGADGLTRLGLLEPVAADDGEVVHRIAPGSGHPHQRAPLTAAELGKTR